MPDVPNLAAALGPKDEPGLTDADFQRIIEWFKDKGKLDNLCSVCGNSKWSVLADMFGAMLVRGGKMISTKGYTFVPIMCAVCGHILLFHAATMGIGPHAKTPEGA